MTASLPGGGELVLDSHRERASGAGHRSGHVRDTRRFRPPERPPARRSRAKKQVANAGLSPMARPGLEPGTPRFSVVEPNLSNSGVTPANLRVVAIDRRGL